MTEGTLPDRVWAWAWIDEDTGTEYVDLDTLKPDGLTEEACEVYVPLADVLKELRAVDMNIGRGPAYADYIEERFATASTSRDSPS